MCASARVMADKIRPVEQMLELSGDEAISAEHLDSQVQKAQEQLLQLKRQQEQIEKQKRELEELSRRQDELENGRTEMADKLTRALVVLEREAYSAQNRLEQIRATRESFTQHLELVEAIDPRSWNPSDLHKELSRALSTVDDARTEYSEQRSRLQAAGATGGEASLPEARQTLTKATVGVRLFSGWKSASRSPCRSLFLAPLRLRFSFGWRVGNGDVSPSAQTAAAASPQATRDSTTGNRTA